MKYNIVYLSIKLDYSSVSHSTDIIGTPKFKIGHMTPTTSLLRVIFHPYTGIRQLPVYKI